MTSHNTAKVELSPVGMTSDGERPPIYPTSPSAGEEGGNSEPAEGLVGLLTRASDVIREERAKVAALRDCLRGVLAAHAADTAGVVAAPLSALSAHVSRERRAMEALLGSGDPLLMPPGDFTATAVASSGHAQVKSKPAVLTSSATVTPRRSHSAPKSYAEQQQQLCRRTPSSNGGGTVGAAPDAATTPPPSTPPPPPQAQTQTQTLAHRLRRALAPVPSKEQLGEVVDAMVHALDSDLRLHRERVPPRALDEDRTVAFVRLAPCTYRLLWGSADSVARTRAASQRGHPPPSPQTRTTARGPHACRVRIVHLTVDSGRLCVLGGGGHVNLLEYLEKSLHVTV